MNFGKEKCRAVFLDRDGVITELSNYSEGSDLDFILEEDKIRFIEGSIEAIKILNREGFKVIVISNQPAVARGLTKLERIKAVNSEIEKMIKNRGAIVDDWFFCYHHPIEGVNQYKINCSCRKPKPGMILKAVEKYNVDLSQSYVIGDRMSDIKAGNLAGCSTIGVKTGYACSDPFKDAKIDLIAKDLFEAVQFIIKPKKLTKKKIEQKLLDSSQLISKIIHTNINDLWNLGMILTKTLKRNKKIMIAGNGGSATDAQHIAGELVNTFYKQRKALAVISLTSDNAVITAQANDVGFESIFERQVEAFGKKGDVLLVISTSGNSINLIKAVNKAKESKIITIGLLGKGGGKLKNLCDYSLIIPHNDVARIQEAHRVVYHLICEIIENNFLGVGKKGGERDGT